MPVALIFLATADLRRPWQIVRRSALPAVLVLLSCAALFYYER